MKRTLLLRKIKSRFVETIAAQDERMSAARSYDNWEQVEERLLQLGFLPHHIAHLQSEFDSGKDRVRVPIP